MTVPEMNNPALIGEGPLYRRLADLLQFRIETGAHPLGTFLPTEAVLCEEFGLSRYTVREALRSLTVRGLVARRQGSGSQVIANKLPVSFTHSMRSLSELFQYALDTRFEFLSVREGRPAKLLAEHAGVPAGSRWLQIVGLRRARVQDQPIAHSHVLIHEDFCELLDEFRQTDGPFYDVIERKTGRMVANVIQSISAGPMGQETARLFGEEAGTAVIRVVRRYLDRSGATLLVSVNDHQAKSFRYEMHLQREG